MQLLWEREKYSHVKIYIYIYEYNFIKEKKKSRIQETKLLSTDADSSTDAIGGWTKNTPKIDFFLKRKISSKTQKTQKRLKICQN